MICDNCKLDVNAIVIHGHALWCWPCHNVTKGVTGVSAAVIGDDIPGGLEVKHGICNPDGTPKKYYSKSEIRQAAYEGGWTISGDTPKPNPRIMDQRQASRERR